MPGQGLRLMGVATSRRVRSSPQPPAPARAIVARGGLFATAGALAFSALAVTAAERGWFDPPLPMEVLLVSPEGPPQARAVEVAASPRREIAVAAIAVSLATAPLLPVPYAEPPSMNGDDGLGSLELDRPSAAPAPEYGFPPRLNEP